MAGGRTTQWRGSQVCCVVAMAILANVIDTSASRHYRFTRIFKPSALLIANGSGRQTAATCTSPSREPVLPFECALVAGCSGAFRTLFPRDRSHRPGSLAPNPVRAGGVGGSIASRHTTKGTAVIRGREGFCSVRVVWVHQWLLPLLLDPKFCLGPPGPPGPRGYIYTIYFFKAEPIRS